MSRCRLLCKCSRAEKSSLILCRYRIEKKLKNEGNCFENPRPDPFVPGAVKVLHPVMAKWSLSKGSSCKVFVDNLVHGDLHPGNIWSKTVPRKGQQGSLRRCLVFGDGESVADLFLSNSEHCCKDPEAFKAEMTSLVNSAREDTIALSQIDVGVLLQQVLRILLHHQVRLESAFSAVVLAVFVLEGLGRALDPNMDILERARPILVTGKVK
ncbi:uncharacterized aarF domain-containing protein kinase 2-like [Penaeus monodon]|uniref:uncharacterized aarF domain-containing protein kinase 2-like n=1 Tax=Penaeus monodon TaxID=6687 RepID=UPI0018A7981E|nr:uncharacterized aarF domain-containing protein kinase 2-like [Penaeus monodon]